MFFEDLIKKLEEENIEYNSTETFYIENRKKIIVLATSIPLIIISLVQLYNYYLKQNIISLALAILFLYFAFKQIKNMLSYKLKIDTKEKTLKYMKLIIHFDDIEKSFLREMKIGNKIIPVIENITKDKKQIIIPLHMNKKIKFIKMCKDIIKGDFIIKK